MQANSQARRSSVRLTEGAETRARFHRDLGNLDQPLIKDPYITEADFSRIHLREQESRSDDRQGWQYDHLAVSGEGTRSDHPKNLRSAGNVIIPPSAWGTCYFCSIWPRISSSRKGFVPKRSLPCRIVRFPSRRPRSLREILYGYMDEETMLYS